MLSYFYDPSMFIYRWNKNFLKKVALERSMAAEMPCVLYCMRDGFEQIIMKLRLTIKGQQQLTAE